MGALIVTYIIGSFVGIPFLALHLLRTRRELNGLRDELRARGVIASSGADATRVPLAAASHDARPLEPGAEAVSADLRRSVDALAVEIERIAERQRFMNTVLEERIGAGTAPLLLPAQEPAAAPAAHGEAAPAEPPRA